MMDGSTADALIVGICILITIAAGVSLAVGIYVSALDMWREYHRKRERPGFIELQPTPDRSRLGVRKGDRRR